VFFFVAFPRPFFKPGASAAGRVGGHAVAVAAEADSAKNETVWGLFGASPSVGSV